MPDSFDGAGKPYRGASYRGLIMVLIVSVIVVGLLWYAYSANLDQVPTRLLPGLPMEPAPS